MSSRIIQAEARITASESTGAAFAAVARNVRGVTQAFKSLGNIGASGIGAMNRNVSRLQRTIHTLAPVAGSAAAYEGMRGISGLVRETVKATAEQAHERVRLELAGVAPAERAEAEKLSLALSQRYKIFSQTDVLHSLRNMRAIIGTYEEAAKLLDPIMKLRVAVLAQHPEHADALNEDFDKLTKAHEILGITQDLPRLVKDMGMIGKAMAVFGDTLKPTDWFEFAQHSRLAGQGFNDEFLFTVGPTLMQHMGGAQAGTALSSLYQALIGAHMTLQAKNELASFGLLDPNKVIFNKAGRLKQMLPGALKEGDLFKEHPYEWMKQVFLPALAAHGVTTKGRFEDVLATVASSRTAGQALAILATQQQNIDKDRALILGAPDLDKQVQIAGGDPFLQAQGVAAQFKNLLSIAGSPLAGAAGWGMKEVAAGLVALENAGKGHPLEATGGLIATLTGAGIGGYKLSNMALRRFFGMVRGGAAAAGDLSGDAAIRVMQGLAPAAAKGPGWFSSALLPLGAGAAMADLETHKRPGERTYFGDRGFGSEISALPALKVWDWLRGLRTDGYSESLAPGADVVKGSADLNVKVEVEPSDAFLTRIETIVRNAISGLGVNGAEPGTGVGTAGSTGLSMPPAAPAP